MKKITLLLITLFMLTCFSSAASLKKTVGGVSVTTTIPEGRTVIMNYTKDATRFSRWVVDTNNLTLTDPTSTTISFKMPAVDVEIRAEEDPDEQLLTVSVDGELIEEMQRSVGESITVTAVEGNGKVFNGWQITGLTGADASANPLTFTMPNNAVEIIATFTEQQAIIANANVPVGAYIEYVPTATSAKAYDTDTGYTTTNGYQEFNPNATQLWRVMYKNGGQLDIVSSDAVYATNGEGLYLYGKTGYAKAVDTLNNLCNQFVNTTYATSGRSIGCTSESVGTITTPITWYYTYDQGNTGSPYTDGLYSADVNQLNNGLLHSSGYTWLASRYLYAERVGSLFSVRYLYSDGNVYDYYVYGEYSDGDPRENDDVNGVRPVVSLSSDIKIIDGDGSSTNPYKITK